MKEVFLDVGELGWSMYLSAHMRWLKKEGHPVPPVMVLPGRECLYEGLTDTILQVPGDFHNLFDTRKQNCFSLHKVSGPRLREYFNSKLPARYCISEKQLLENHKLRCIFPGQKLFEPYPSELSSNEKNEILIFPRRRALSPFSHRNLSELFYISLISRICDENKDCVVRTMGTLSGAYHIMKERVSKSNYVNSVGETSSLQAVIDRCQVAICTVGGTSALPKLAMLQGVPSFIVGHEDARFKVGENWRRTKVGFYHISHLQYGTFDFEGCIGKIILFVKEICDE